MNGLLLYAAFALHLHSTGVGGAYSKFVVVVVAFETFFPNATKSYIKVKTHSHTSCLLLIQSSFLLLVSEQQH